MRPHKVATPSGPFLPVYATLNATADSIEREYNVNVRRVELEFGVEGAEQRLFAATDDLDALAAHRLRHHEARPRVDHRLRAVRGEAALHVMSIH